jgi:hypothetical protein
VTCEKAIFGGFADFWNVTCSGYSFEDMLSNSSGDVTSPPECVPIMRIAADVENWLLNLNFVIQMLFPNVFFAGILRELKLCFLHCKKNLTMDKKNAAD